MQNWRGWGTGDKSDTRKLVHSGGGADCSISPGSIITHAETESFSFFEDMKTDALP